MSDHHIWVANSLVNTDEGQVLLDRIDGISHEAHLDQLETSRDRWGEDLLAQVEALETQDTASLLLPSSWYPAGGEAHPKLRSWLATSRLRVGFLPFEKINHDWTPYFRIPRLLHPSLQTPLLRRVIAPQEDAPIGILDPGANIFFKDGVTKFEDVNEYIDRLLIYYSKMKKSISPGTAFRIKATLEHFFGIVGRVGAEMTSLTAGTSKSFCVATVEFRSAKFNLTELQEKLKGAAKVIDLQWIEKDHGGDSVRLVGVVSNPYEGYLPQAEREPQVPLGLFPWVSQAFKREELKEGHFRIDLDHLGKSHLAPKTADTQDPETHFTALMEATVNNDEEAVDLLLESGANPNLEDVEGHTALSLAAECRSPEITQSLLEAGANPNHKDSMGNSPLHQLAYSNPSSDPSGSSAKVNQKNLARQSKFLQMNSKDSDKSPKGQLDHDLEGPDFKSRTMERDSSEQSISGELGTSSEEGGDFTPQSHLYSNEVEKSNMASWKPDQDTGEFKSRQISSGDPNLSKMVDALVSKGADLNEKNNFNQTPLDLAKKLGNLGVVQEFSEKGGEKREGSVKFAGADPQKEISPVVEIKKEKGKENENPSKEFSISEVSFQAFELPGKNEKAKLFESHMVRKMMEDTVQSPGKGPLFKAAWENQLSDLKSLLREKQDPNQQDQSGTTPIMLAAIRGYNSIIKNLIVAGADVNAKNVHGLTPLALSCLEGKSGVVRLLLQYNARTKLWIKGSPLICVIAAMGDLKTLKELVSGGASVELQDFKGRKALNYAAFYKHRLVAKYLKTLTKS